MRKSSTGAMPVPQSTQHNTHHPPRLDLQLHAHPLDEHVDVEGLLQEVVGSGELEFLDLVVFHHAGDADDPHILEAGVGPHAMADFLAVDVRQHHVQDDEVGAVFLDHHAGVEAVGSNANLEAAVLLEGLVHDVDQFGIVVHEKDLPLAALQSVRRNVVVLHELVQRLTGNPPELGARNPETLELTIVEAADDGLLADLADLCGFAGREHGLHTSIHLAGARRPHEGGPWRLDRAGTRTEIRP